MSQDNKFYQYGYDHYLKAPIKSRGSSGPSFGKRTGVMSKLKSPAVATVALLAAGALFAGVIISTYPAEEGQNGTVPIVKADLRPVRVSPESRGGMDIPNSDSTIMARVGQSQGQDVSERVENLLARNDEELISKEKALEQAMAENPMMPDDGFLSSVPAPDVASAPLTSTRSNDVSDIASLKPRPLLSDITALERSAGAERGKTLAENNILQKIESDEGNEKIAEPFEIEEPKPVAALSETLTEPVQSDNESAAILQKIGGDTQSQETSSEFAAITAQAAAARKPYNPTPVAAVQVEKVTQQPTQMHAAATSPETIDFVRKVLESTPEELASGGAERVEPAAGGSSYSNATREPVNAAPIAREVKPATVVAPAVGTSAPAITGGIYFVQLASITEAARADKEWMKMKADYSVLSDSQFRVQEAVVNSNTFYRIQAGPMSKESAESVCSALKNAGKPGGCLVVK